MVGEGVGDGGNAGVGNGDVIEDEGVAKGDSIGDSASG